MALSDRHLILGAGGFLGRHLQRALEAEGREVTPVARSSAGEADDSTICLDLFSTDTDALTTIVEGHAVVHHLAWSTVPATADADPERDLHENVGLMARVLEATRRTGARLVFSSSGGTVYGSAEEVSIPEDHPLRPLSAYGVAKAAAEQLAEAARREHEQDVRIARLSNAYGAGQPTDRPQGVLTRFARDALGGRTLEVWGDGEVVRDYIHVIDAVAGLKTLALAERDDLGGGAAFNIASGVGTSVNTLIQLLAEALRRELTVVRTSGRRFDVPRNVLDVTRAAERLNWRPKLALAEGVERLLTDLRADPGRLFSSDPAEERAIAG